MTAKSGQKICDLVKRRWNNEREYWRPANDLYGRLIAFNLDLQHYLWNEGVTKDRRRVQPKTQKQLNLTRHKASMLLRRMPEFDGHAVQPGSSSKAAEVSRRVIENVFMDPLKGYHDPRSRMVWSFLAGGRGNIGIDWHPKWGIVFRGLDPRRFHIAVGHVFLHSPLTPCCTEEVPMKMSEVEKMKGVWDVPSDLNADDWKPDYAEGNAPQGDMLSLRGQYSASGHGEDLEEGDRIVTVLKSWYREDPYQYATKAEREADLPIEEWHFVDDQTGESQPFDPTQPEPPVGATGQPMRLVTRDDQRYSAQEMSKGYLVITAPFYAGRKPLFEGSWTEGALNPRAVLSAFPYMEMTCYKHPLKRQGLSDTEATHSLVIVDNASHKASFDQMRQSGAIMVTQPGALTDSQGNQFQISDDPVSIAYAERLQAEGIQYHQLPGMNPAMPAYRQMVNDAWQAVGTGDFSASLGPDRSKDIAASTLSQLQESGDLPVQLHQQDLDLQEGIGARCVLDLCSAYMGDNVVSWVTDQGEQAYATVRGEDLVPLHVTVSAGKEFRQQDIDRIQAQAQFLAMLSKLGLPPKAQIAMMREAQFSPSVVDAVAESMDEASKAPKVEPDKLMSGLATLFKSGVTVGMDSVNAVLQQAGLPPITNQDEMIGMAKQRFSLVEKEGEAA